MDVLVVEVVDVDVVGRVEDEDDVDELVDVLVVDVVEVVVGLVDVDELVDVVDARVVDVEVVVDGDDVVVLLVEVLVVVLAHCTPQHGRSGSWTRIGGGTGAFVMTGTLVR